MKLRLATLAFLSLLAHEVWSDLGCEEAQPDCIPEKDWASIFGEVFDSVSSENAEKINLNLMKHMRYIRENVRPKCPMNWHDDQLGFRDLSNPNCLIDETFIKLLSLSNKLKCSTLDCSNSGSVDWESDELIRYKRTMLMWLDIVPVEHGRIISAEDRDGIIDFIVDNLYIHVKENNFFALQEFVRSLRLPSLHQMYQITGTCTLQESRWENDLACPWRNVLDNVFTLTNIYKGRNDKVKHISKSIDYTRKLELRNLKNIVEDAALDTQESLEQFTDFMLSVINNKFDKLEDYFSTLADFDNDIAEADIGYITNSLDKFKRKQDELTEELKDISDRLAAETKDASSADSLSAWLKFSVSLALGIVGIIGKDPSGLMDAWDKLDETAAATANAIRAGTLENLMEEVNSDLSTVYSAFNKNRDLLDDAMDIVKYESNPDSSGEISDTRRTRFLAAYNAYDPGVITVDIVRLDERWTNVLEVIKASLDDMSQAAASVFRGKIYAKNYIEDMAVLISEITALLESRFEFQFNLMDALAASLRAKLAKNSVQKLSDSIEDARNHHSLKFARKQAALNSLITLRIHTLQTLQLHCNVLEFRNAGEMPTVCTNAMQSLSDSTIADVITFTPESCLESTSDVSIPVTKKVRKGAINLLDLYSGKLTSFQIPDAQWLVDNGWVHKSEAESKVFYLKGFRLYLVSQEETSGGRWVLSSVTALGAAPLVKNGNQHTKYGLLPEQTYTFSYRENIPPSCRQTESNPYQLCEQLSDICPIHRKDIDNEYDLYPSIFSEWEIEVPDLHENTEIPKFFEDEDRLYLQARINLCSKSPSREPNTTLQQKPLFDSLARCSAGNYFNRQKNAWTPCPEGAIVALGGHYCKPGKVD